jgi:predicted Zn-dependent protease
LIYGEYYFKMKTRRVMKLEAILELMRRIIVLLAVFSLLSCAVNPVSGERELMLVTETQEIELGRQAGPSLNWTYGGEFHDPTLKRYLESIVQRLWENSERPHLPMEFAIENTSLPNAFALPGYVAITRGLLAELENEAQFAAIMGHEVGHVMARHSAKRITLGSIQQMGLVLGGTMLGDSEGADTLMTLGAVGSSLLLLKYDRGQELQSDRLGVKYMANLGYDPHEAIGAHERLNVAVNNYLERQGKEKTGDNLLNAIFSTHPRHEVRKEEMVGMIKELPPYRMSGDGKFGKRFHSALSGLHEINRVYFIYDRALMLYNSADIDGAERNIKKALAVNSEQAPFYHLYGMILLKREDYASAERFFRRALKRDGAYQPSLFGLGMVAFNKGDYYDASEHFRRSLDLYPDHLGSNFGLGKTLFSLKQYRKALPYIRKTSSSVPKHPEIHGLLGICYEKTGDSRSALGEYELQVRIAPNTELGRYSQQRLSLLKESTKQRQNR